MQNFLKSLKKAVLLSIVMLIICGLLYPLALTGVSQIAFNKQANGNLVKVDGVAVGSKLIGQNFSDKRFFKGRPSAVNYNTYTEADTIPDGDGNVAYAGVASGSQNLAASNPDLQKRVKEDIEKFLEANPDVKKEDIPADLMTASGSGLDPHISAKSAKIQIPAIAKATGLSEDTLQKIVKENTSEKLFGIFGEEKVNVLESNIDVAKEIGLI